MLNDLRTMLWKEAKVQFRGQGKRSNYLRQLIAPVVLAAVFPITWGWCFQTLTSATRECVSRDIFSSTSPGPINPWCCWRRWLTTPAAWGSADNAIKMDNPAKPRPSSPTRPTSTTNEFLHSAAKASSTWKRSNASTCPVFVRPTRTSAR